MLSSSSATIAAPLPGATRYPRFMTATKRLTAGADVAAGRWVVVVLDDGRFSRALLAAQGIELPDHLDDPAGKVPPDTYRFCGSRADPLP